MKISICFSKKANSLVTLTPMIVKVIPGEGRWWCSGAASGWCGVVECCGVLLVLAGKCQHWLGDIASIASSPVTAP